MDKRPAGLLPELIIPFFAMGFGIYYLSTVWTLPFQAKVVGIYVTSGIFLLCAVLAVRFVRQLMAGKKDLSFHGFLADPATEGRRWGVFAATVLFILLMPVLGFAVALFLFVLSTVLLVGGRERVKAAFIVATSITVIAFSVFILFVQVRFPLSFVDQAILGLVR